MNRLTLATLDTPIARILNVCPGDARIAEYANRVERRLVAKGKWVGTTARYRICTTESCLVWPRFIETIEAWWLCKTPGMIRNGWYEDSLQGPGMRTSNDGGSPTLIDRDPMPTFAFVRGNTSKLAVRADVTEAADARMLIQGYNQNGEWIRTQDGAVWVEGEYLPISTVTAYSNNVFSSIARIIKPVTQGPVRLWQYDPVTATTVQQLGLYEPDETLPWYRASIIPGLGFQHGCGNSNDTCCGSTSNQVTVKAKLNHIDVSRPTDFLLLGNEGAFTLGVQAILKEERNLPDEAAAYWAMAVQALEDELSSYEGDGAIPTFKYEGRDSWGAGVFNPITLGWPITW